MAVSHTHAFEHSHRGLLIHEESLNGIWRGREQTTMHEEGKNLRGRGWVKSVYNGWQHVSSFSLSLSFIYLFSLVPKSSSQCTLLSRKEAKEAVITIETKKMHNSSVLLFPFLDGCETIKMIDYSKESTSHCTRSMNESTSTV